LLHAANVEITAIKVSPAQFVELIALVKEKAVTMNTGKQILEIMFDTGKAASDIVAEEGLGQIVDADRLSPIVDEVISANPDAVAQYKAGKDAVLRFFVGQVMRATRGKADPNLAANLLKQKLSG